MFDFSRHFFLNFFFFVDGRAPHCGGLPTCLQSVGRKLGMQQRGQNFVLFLAVLHFKLLRIRSFFRRVPGVVSTRFRERCSFELIIDADDELAGDVRAATPLKIDVRRQARNVRTCGNAQTSSGGSAMWITL